MATTFFTDLFDSLDAATVGLGDGMTNVLDVVMPVFGSVFVVYMIFVVWGYWQNGASIEGTAIDALKRIVGLGLIMGLGLNYGTYSSTVFPFVTDFGDGLAQVWGGTEEAGTALDSIIDKVVEITDTNQMDAETALDNEVVDPDLNEPPVTPPVNTPEEDQGIISSAIDSVTGMGEAVFANTIGKLGNTLTALTQSILIWLSAAVFLVVAAAYLLVAQVILILLAAVGPIFFAFAIFPATRQFFTNWIGSVLNYGFLFLFMTVSAQIFITYIDSLLDTWKGEFMAGAVLQPSMLISILAMFFVFAAMLMQIPSVTSSLFGGLAAGGFGEVLRTAKSSVAAAGGAFAGGKAAYGAAKKGLSKIGKGKGGSVSAEKDGK